MSAPVTMNMLEKIQSRLEHLSKSERKVRWRKSFLLPPRTPGNSFQALPPSP